MHHLHPFQERLMCLRNSRALVTERTGKSLIYNTFQKCFQWIIFFLSLSCQWMHVICALLACFRFMQYLPCHRTHSTSGTKDNIRLFSLYMYLCYSYHTAGDVFLSYLEHRFFFDEWLTDWLASYQSPSCAASEHRSIKMHMNIPGLVEDYRIRWLG